MILITWCAVKYVAGGQTGWACVFNTVVHIFMYMYYFLAAYNPENKHIPMKKYITRIQLVRITFLSSFICFFIPIIIDDAIEFNFAKKNTEIGSTPQNILLLSLVLLEFLKNIPKIRKEQGILMNGFESIFNTIQNFFQSLYHNILLIGI